MSLETRIQDPEGSRPTEVRRFSEEARKALEGQGYIVYELFGKSIAQLRSEGNPFSSTWHNDYPNFEAIAAGATEAALNPKNLFLKKSNRKTPFEHEEMVAYFSQKLAKKIPGVRAIIGEASQYAELAFSHYKATGVRLFGEKYNYDYVRTKTPGVGSDVAYVGRFGNGGLGVVSRWYASVGHGYLWAAPLVVPA